MNRALQISAVTLALTIGPCVTAQTPQPPTAPLPTQLTTAHKIFIGNAGDQENADCLRAYNVFYAGIQGLKNFELVLDPKDADLVLELHYEIGFGASVNSGQPTPAPVPRRSRRPEDSHHPLVAHRAHQLCRLPEESRQEPRRNHGRAHQRLQLAHITAARRTQQPLGHPPLNTSVSQQRKDFE